MNGEMPGSGDHEREDFGAQVAAEIPGLYRYARSLVGSSADAEDIVGETVARAIKNRENFRGESSLRTWLHSILHNLAVDLFRHQQHEVFVGELQQGSGSRPDAPDISEDVVRAETAVALRDALVHLPFGYRSAVILHDAEGWTMSEVAASLDINLAAAKQRLRRGRMMLVRSLSLENERRLANRNVPLGCWEARMRVSEYLDDELTRDERMSLESHLARCASCPPLHQALVGAKVSLGALHDSDRVIEPGLAKRLNALLEA